MKHSLESASKFLVKTCWIAKSNRRLRSATVATTEEEEAADEAADKDVEADDDILVLLPVLSFVAMEILFWNVNGLVGWV